MLQHCLTNYDEQFKQIDGLKWLPWIGHFYNSTRTIILGESQYEEGSDWQEKNINAARDLISIHISGRKGRPYYNIEKVLLASNRPSPEQSNFLWKSVVFWNVVQRLMSSREERPNDSDFYNGWKLFFTIIDVLQPQPTICIVLGKSSYGQLGYFLNVNDTSWDRNVHEFQEQKRVINLSRSGQKLKLFFINHPSGSRGFKYEHWAQLISVEEPNLRQLLMEKA